MEALKAIELKMRNAGLRDAAIRSFRQNYLTFISGETGLIPENTIKPVEELPRLDDLAASVPAEKTAALIAKTAVIKLNGGLGTSMGLDLPKSLIKVKDDWNFLDFMVQQILHLRQTYQVPLRLLLLNSYNTSKESMEYLAKYSDLAVDLPIEFIQSKAPKLRADSLLPIEWKNHPEMEWCPPGHGDIYPTLLDTGLLDQFEKRGINFLFISNADNLGANLDLGLLNYFAESGVPFLMEVAERTASDKKGGHLACSANGGLLLRESAQCPEEDEAAFQDIGKHRFFNTNNIWIRVDRLRQQLAANGNILQLPLIRNIKTVDPKDKKTPKVYQLETAMGAAIQLFEGAGAIVVPRRRFAPVKTTADLLSLRSDAYMIKEDFTLALDASRQGIPPKIDLDDEHYKILSEFEEAFGQNVPSLLTAEKLQIKGPILCQSGVGIRVEGEVRVQNLTATRKSWPGGNYKNTTVIL